MHTIVTPQQRSLFLKQHYLHLCEVFTKKQINEWTEIFELQSTARNTLYNQLESMKKCVMNRTLMQLLHALSGEKKLRFLTDLTLHESDIQRLKDCLDQGHLLKDTFSFSEVTIGALIALEDSECEAFDPLLKGDVVFLNYPWTVDIQCSHGSLLLLVYGLSNSMYILNANDPQSFAMKAFGYQYGDRLKSDLNPLHVT